MQSSKPQQITVTQAMDIAVAHHRDGRIREAEGIYRQILSTYPDFAPAVHMLGVVIFQSGRRDEGIALIRKALSLQPVYAEAQANLGHLLREIGQIDEAIAACRRAIEIKPDLAEGYINLGSALYTQGKFEEAANCQRQAIALRPNYPDAYTNLGNALQAVGKNEEAVEAHRKAVEFRPNFPEGHNNLAAALHTLGRVDEAIEHYRTALKQKPDYPEAMSNLGHALQGKGQLDEAIALCRRAVQIQPNNPDAYNNMGNALQEKADVEQGIACFKKALLLKPDHVDAMNNLGNCYQEQGKMEEAVQLYRQAIVLRPLFAKAYGNLGNALRALGQLDESIKICNKAVELQPTLEEAHINLGTALHMAGRYEEGVAACRRAIVLRNNFPEAHKDLSLMLLVQGKFEEGWREYEWRLRLPHYFNAWDRFPQPLWDGSSLEGKTILIHSEQGLGDTINFCRFIPLVMAKGAKVILECQKELVSLMEQTEILRGVQVVPRLSKKGPSEKFDVHLPLLSLPWLLQKLDPTQYNDVPWPPYVKPNPKLHEEWQARMGPRTGALRVGIAWAGSKTNKNDRLRSINLSSFAPLARDGVEFYNLQLGKPGEQAANPPPGMKLIDLTKHIKDFSDTAAMVAELDLIVTVDTAIVHLAGVMCKPVWVVIQFTPDFRWLLEGDTTPWYQSVRLFRQKTFGDWAEPIQRMADALGDFKPSTS